MGTFKRIHSPEFSGDIRVTLRSSELAAMNDLEKMGNLDSQVDLTWGFVLSFFTDPDYYIWFFPGLLTILAFLVGVNYFTRTGSIARATTKEAVRQPIFLLLLAVGTIVMLANIYIPFFSLGDDTKMFIDCGLATILICSLLVAIWTASLSVAEEIEGKTAMTLLSKPITRREFIMGKYLGIVQTTLWMILYFGTLLVCLIFFLKAGIDAKESSATVTSIERLRTALQVLPGLALVFMEVAIMTSISVAISTRLPMIVNVTTCLVIFVIGHLTPRSGAIIQARHSICEVHRPTVSDHSAGARQLQHVGCDRDGHPDSGGLHRLQCAVQCLLRFGDHPALFHLVRGSRPRVVWNRQSKAGSRWPDILGPSVPSCAA